MPKKAFIAIIAAIILLVGGVFVYQAWQEKQLIDQSTQSQATQSGTANWKIYKNDKYGFTFEYPEDWLLAEKNMLYGDQVEMVTIISPEHDKQFEEDSRKELFEGGYYYNDFSVSYCKNINTDCARGGDGKTSYSSIGDFLAAEEQSPVALKARSKILPNVSIGDLQGYGVVSIGLGANYEVMVEHNGIYLLDFPSSDLEGAENYQLTPEQQHILSSFRFTR